MIINNLELIKPFLKFESNDIYYHLSILKRKKDCAEHEKGGELQPGLSVG